MNFVSRLTAGVVPYIFTLTKLTFVCSSNSEVTTDAHKYHTVTGSVGFNTCLQHIFTVHTSTVTGSVGLNTCLQHIFTVHTSTVTGSVGLNTCLHHIFTVHTSTVTGSVGLKTCLQHIFTVHTSERQSQKWTKLLTFVFVCVLSKVDCRWLIRI